MSGSRLPSRRSSARGVASSVLISAALIGIVGAGCTQGALARGRVRGLERTVVDAERNGAIRCAPRELALARAHLEFASVNLDQGELSRAEGHLAIAEPNARAAFESSPPDRCAGRDFVEVVQAKPGDRDGDGIIDPKDRCIDKRETYNGFQDDDGCPDDPDTDGDGIPDSIDHCILEPEDKDGYLDDDGCPEIDNDGDGIPDVLDKKCPNEPEDFDGFQDEDGCPDPDNDGDGVLDVDDFCPNTPGLPAGDKPGCPKKAMNAALTTREIRISQQIQFAPGLAIIQKVSFKVLDEVVQVMKDYPKITIEVQGHTDNQGAAAYNLALSQSRSEAVRKYLISKGIVATRLTAKGFGMTQPLVPNTTAANKGMNRRVQFIRTESNPPATP